MSLASDSVALFRSQWASRFVDEVSVVRFSSGGTYNPTTRKHDATADSTIVAAGSPNALIRPGGGEADEEQLAVEQRTYTEYDVLLPHDTPELQVEDRISVVASVSEPELVGKTLTVTAIVRDSYNTRRRVVAELDLGRGSGRG